MNRKRQSSPILPPAAGILLLLSTAGLTAYVIHLALTLPVVYVSHLTQRCTRVDPPQAGTCTRLPKKYSTIHVQ